MSGADGLAIRDMTAADLPALTDLWIAAWQATLTGIDFEGRRGWFVDNARRHADAGGRTLVAELHGATLGFMMLEPASGYLDQIAVAPESRGSGVADRLIARAKELAPRGIDLEVNTDNARAIRFYERHGFVRGATGVNARSGLATVRMSWRPP